MRAPENLPACLIDVTNGLTAVHKDDAIDNSLKHQLQQGCIRTLCTAPRNPQSIFPLEIATGITALYTCPESPKY